MNADLPLWIILPTLFFLLLGSSLTLLGAIGLVRFKNFYDRLHMPTLGTTWGVGSIIIASIIYSSFIAGRPILHELLLTIFLVVTTPVTLMMLSRAAMHRDETQDRQQHQTQDSVLTPYEFLQKRADSQLREVPAAEPVGRLKINEETDTP